MKGVVGEGGGGGGLRFEQNVDGQRTQATSFRFRKVNKILHCFTLIFPYKIVVLLL